jgi:hypothetical protein
VGLRLRDLIGLDKGRFTKSVGVNIAALASSATA